VPPKAASLTLAKQSGRSPDIDKHARMRASIAAA
jgi:hypothetical protein